MYNRKTLLEDIDNGIKAFEQSGKAPEFLVTMLNKTPAYKWRVLNGIRTHFDNKGPANSGRYYIAATEWKRSLPKDHDVETQGIPVFMEAIEWHDNVGRPTANEFDAKYVEA